VVGGVIGIAGADVGTGAWLRAEVSKAGLPQQLTLEADLLAVFCTGSLAGEGYALVAGTGAAAVRIRNWRIEATADGLGWLLGDAGSGFWLGHRALRAAARELDRRGPPTRLTELVLRELGAEHCGPGRHGRHGALDHAVATIYRLRPVELARLAPLVFEAEAAGDELAGQLLADASKALATTLATVVVPAISGPLVLGGSVLSCQPSFAAGVVESFRTDGRGPLITVSDGIAGAAVLALREGGGHVDEVTFARIHSSLATRRGR
jgi:N-acetylglucosamine kinase-like BadF-type ATPase